MTIEAMAPASTMPRPSRRDPHLVRQAAERIADVCVEWDPTSRRGDWIAALVDAVHEWNDGYRLARHLERHAHVDPDAELVEALVEAGDALDAIVADAERDWVRIVGFEPAFAVGDMVTMRHGTGPVHSVDEERARYVVDVERRRNGGIYANAEDVVAADDAKAAA